RGGGRRPPPLHLLDHRQGLEGLRGVAQALVGPVRALPPVLVELTGPHAPRAYGQPWIQLPRYSPKPVSPGVRPSKVRWPPEQRKVGSPSPLTMSVSMWRTLVAPSMTNRSEKRRVPWLLSGTYAPTKVSVK